MECWGLVALLLIMAGLPTGYTDVKWQTDFRRVPAAVSYRLNSCRVNKWRFLKDEKYLTW